MDGGKGPRKKKKKYIYLLKGDYRGVVLTGGFCTLGLELIHRNPNLPQPCAPRTRQSSTEVFRVLGFEVVGLGF